jgi:hypothetical protein
MQLAQFRKNLVEHFNTTEMKDLCFDLGIRSELLSGENIGDMARELIYHCRRHDLGTVLAAECKKRRPKVDWVWSDEFGSVESPAVKDGLDVSPLTGVDLISTESKSGRSITFEWASEILPNANRLATASAINWIAISNRKTLENIRFKKAITACLEQGGYVRLILLHPNSPDCQFLADYSQEYKETSGVQNDIISALKIIATHYQKKGRIEVRFVKYPPPYRLMLVDQNQADEKGLYMRLRWVVVSNAEDVPTVVASENKDPQMKDFIEFMAKQFEAFWNFADVEKISSIIKRHSDST